MGQQTNKIQKRRRRLAYIARVKAKTKAIAAKPVKKKAAPKKVAASAVA
ncbi:MAG: hypothetical protein WCI46_08290 [Verrucomicrobiota bacterium]